MKHDKPFLKESVNESRPRKIPSSTLGGGIFLRENYFYIKNYIIFLNTKNLSNS